MSANPPSAVAPRARLLSRQASGTLLLGCWLALSLFAYSHRLHHWLHHAATHHAHPCALVSLVQGVSVETGPAHDPVPVPPPFFTHASRPPRVLERRGLPAHRLPYACGPPVPASVS